MYDEAGLNAEQIVAAVMESGIRFQAPGVRKVKGKACLTSAC